MTTHEDGAQDDAAIRAVVDDLARAIRSKDVDGVMAEFAYDVVSFDLGPPLQHAGGEPFKKRWLELFEAYQGPIDYEVRDLKVSTGGDVAFSHSLNHISGSLKSGDKVDRWLRWTACYRRTSGRWRIVHEQVSVPIDVGTGKAVLDLRP